MSAYALGQLVAARLWCRLAHDGAQTRADLDHRSGSRGAGRYGQWSHDGIVDHCALCVGVICRLITVAYAYVADVTTRESRAKVMGWIGSAFGLGFIFGRDLGGLLAGSVDAVGGFVRVVLPVAAIQAVAAIYAFAFLSESLSKDDVIDTFFCGSHRRRHRCHHFDRLIVVSTQNGVSINLTLKK